MTRRTKIICTLGPSTDNEAVMRALIEEGMNVARFNFSHGPHDEQMGRLKMLRKLRKELGKYVAALLDTKGPEIRLVEFEKGKTELKTGQTFTLTTDDILGTDERVSITYKNLADDVKPGDHILIDDGLVGLEVVEIKPVAKPVNTKVNARDIVCKVLNDGVISNKKGVNVPNVDLTMPFISEKDYGDICFAVENDYDFIAASFVRTAEDVMEIRKILAEKGGDFEGMLHRVSDGRLAHEMLVRAAKTTQTNVKGIDATAGMGEDAFLLAACGYEMTLYEQNPVVAVLLKDALRRAKKHPKLKDIAARMQLVENNSVDELKSRVDDIDLIYLDPMFPGRQKSGLINKKLQLIQKLEPPCSDEVELFEAAIQAKPSKIIVKRPLKSPFLAGKNPTYELKGKAIRYDCYAL